MLQKLLKMSLKTFNLAQKYKKLSIFGLFWATKAPNLLLENLLFTFWKIYFWKKYILRIKFKYIKFKLIKLENTRK